MAELILSNIEHLVQSWLEAERNGDRFPVPFDAAWQIAGYSNKANAKRKLVRFKKDADYILESKSLFDNTGRTPEVFKLTPECFFALCFIANTDNPIKVGILHYLTKGSIKLHTDFNNQDKAGFVYLVRVAKTPYYKIGCSKKTYQRLQTLQTGSPLEIKIVERLFTLDCQSLEKDLHDYYSAYWVRGEWFDFPEEVVREFYSVAHNLDKTREESQPCLESGSDEFNVKD